MHHTVQHNAQNAERAENGTGEAKGVGEAAHEEVHAVARRHGGSHLDAQTCTYR